jgi:hypothetical protein
VEEVRILLEGIRDIGALVGLGTHNPAVIAYAEEHEWPVDFYMASLHNITKVDHASALAGGSHVEEPFDEPDRAAMLQAARSTSKPCLLFKVLGAGRYCDSPEQVESAFREVLEGCKPSDALVVGMWQKHKDQLEENARYVRKYAKDGT